MEELTMKIEDVEALVDEVADIAYDKAVEVVADTVNWKRTRRILSWWSSLRRGFSPLSVRLQRKKLSMQ